MTEPSSAADEGRQSDRASAASLLLDGRIAVADTSLIKISTMGRLSWR